MITAHLFNWDNESRVAGTAYIKILNGNSNQWDATVTVAPRQSAASALSEAGWKVVSGVRRSNGRPVVMVERKRPGLDEVNARMTNLIGPILSR